MFSGFKSLVGRQRKRTGRVELAIPIDDIESVQMLERAQKLGSVEPTAPLVELALTLQMIEELSTVD